MLQQRLRCLPASWPFMMQPGEHMTRAAVPWLPNALTVLLWVSCLALSMVGFYMHPSTS